MIGRVTVEIAVRADLWWSRPSLPVCRGGQPGRYAGTARGRAFSRPQESQEVTWWGQPDLMHRAVQRFPPHGHQPTGSKFVGGVFAGGNPLPFFLIFWPPPPSLLSLLSPLSLLPLLPLLPYLNPPEGSDPCLRQAPWLAQVACRMVSLRRYPGWDESHAQ
jgi:hypothetical protein